MEILYFYKFQKVVYQLNTYYSEVTQFLTLKNKHKLQQTA